MRNTPLLINSVCQLKVCTPSTQICLKCKRLMQGALCQVYCAISVKIQANNPPRPVEKQYFLFHSLSLRFTKKLAKGDLSFAWLRDSSIHRKFFFFYCFQVVNLISALFINVIVKVYCSFPFVYNQTFRLTYPLDSEVLSIGCELVLNS